MLNSPAKKVKKTVGVNKKNFPFTWIAIPLLNWLQIYFTKFHLKPNSFTQIFVELVSIHVPNIITCHAFIISLLDFNLVPKNSISMMPYQVKFLVFFYFVYINLILYALLYLLSSFYNVKIWILTDCISYDLQ